MKTYQSFSIHEALTPTIKKLNKKFSSQIAFLKAVWKEIAPDWALNAVPTSIKNKTVTLRAKKDGLILQFREKELLRVVKLILGDEIEKVKVFAQ